MTNGEPGKNDKNEEMIRLQTVVTEACLHAYRTEATIDPILLSVEIMKQPEFPMHAPIHHQLVPAVLLTAARKVQGRPIEMLERDLSLARERAACVPGGACGNMGACGACVGVGIAISLLTDASPLSTTGWVYANRGTAHALDAIAEVGGPRCCKRTTWLSTMRARELFESILNHPLKWTDKVVCEFHDRNRECLREACPFYPSELKHREER